MPFAVTVKSDATNKTPDVASVRHMSVELSTTPQIARIDKAVAMAMQMIETVRLPPARTGLISHWTLFAVTGASLRRHVKAGSWHACSPSSHHLFIGRFNPPGGPHCVEQGKRFGAAIEAIPI